MNGIWVGQVSERFSAPAKRQKQEGLGLQLGNIKHRAAEPFSCLMLFFLTCTHGCTHLHPTLDIMHPRKCTHAPICTHFRPWVHKLEKWVHHKACSKFLPVLLPPPPLGAPPSKRGACRCSGLQNRRKISNSGKKPHSWRGVSAKLTGGVGQASHLRAGRKSSSVLEHAVLLTSFVL